jgi:hypothetical protein
MRRVKSTAPKYLYVVYDKRKNIKVGVSLFPEERVKTLQTSNPEELILLYKGKVGNTSQEAYKEEDKIHKLLREHRVSGEWFNRGCFIELANYLKGAPHKDVWLSTRFKCRLGHILEYGKFTSKINLKVISYMQEKGLQDRLERL